MHFYTLVIKSPKHIVWLGAADELKYFALAECSSSNLKQGQWLERHLLEPKHRFGVTFLVQGVIAGVFN